MNVNRDRFHRLARKAIGVALAYSGIGAVLGLHRLWMRQKWWWVHPLAFAAYLLASNRFFVLNGPYFAEAARHYPPHLGGYAHAWLLLVAAGWMLFVLHDWVMVWFWPAPAKLEQGSHHES